MQQITAGSIPRRFLVSAIASSSRTACRVRPFSSSTSSKSYVGATPIVIPPGITIERVSLSAQSSAAASTSASAEKDSTSVKDRLVVRGSHGETSIKLYDYMRFLLPGAEKASTDPNAPKERKVKRRNPPCPEAATSDPFSVSSNPSTSTSNEAAQDQITLFVSEPTEKTQRQLWGSTRTLIANAITGQSDGYTLPLYLIGVGYRAALEVDKSTMGVTASAPSEFVDVENDGVVDPIVSLKTNEILPRRRLVLRLGYSHVIYRPVPPDIKVTVQSPTIITLWGRDKQKVGQFAADIRALRKPEVYKGKGVFVGTEKIKMKVGKKK